MDIIRESSINEKSVSLSWCVLWGVCGCVVDCGCFQKCSCYGESYCGFF